MCDIFLHAAGLGLLVRAAAGLIANSRSREGLAEEQPGPNKDVDVVVDVMHRAGLSLKVARLRPLGLIKG